MVEQFLAGSAALFGDPITIAIFVFGVVGGMLFGAIPGVSMLTPGMAPNSMPPTTPKTKIAMVIGSPKRAALPARNCSTMIVTRDSEGWCSFSG